MLELSGQVMCIVVHLHLLCQQDKICNYTCHGSFSVATIRKKIVYVVALLQYCHHHFLPSTIR